MSVVRSSEEVLAAAKSPGVCIPRTALPLLGPRFLQNFFSRWKLTKASLEQSSLWEWGRRETIFSLGCGLWLSIALVELHTSQVPYLQPIYDLSLVPLSTHVLYPAMLTLASFVIFCVGFTVLDVIHYDSTKLQRDWWPSWHDIWKAAFPQLLIYGSLSLGGHLMMPDEKRWQVVPVAAPSLLRFGFELAACFVVGDFFIYWEHRIMHRVTFLRNHIHSWHHYYHAPFSWAGGIVHPLEDVVVICCQMFYPTLTGVHPLSLWVFLFSWTALLIEEHSGHDVFWAPWNWLPLTSRPLGGGATPHDVHHYRVNVNFSFVFCVWDVIFDTYREPQMMEENGVNRFVPDYPSQFRQWWEFKHSPPEVLERLQRSYASKKTL